MKEYSLSYRKLPYKCVIFFSVLYMATLLCSVVVGNKLVIFNFGGLYNYASAASFIFPLCFVLGDIIAEVYGYQISKQLLWSALTTQFFFALACVLMIHLPSPPFWHGEKGYNLVLGHLIRMYFSQLTGLIIAGFINIYAISKWKILLRGRYFWLRSIGASSIGEILYALIAIPMIMMGRMSFNEIVPLVIWSIVIKLSYAILFAYPATLCVKLLRIIENINIEEQVLPFSFLLSET